jgi:hypothetical protein
MKTKAQTLAEIGGRLSKFRVPDIDYFTVAAWRADSAAILARLAARFGSAAVAVRSSAHGEDGSQQTQAGAYDSVLNVPAGEAPTLAAAIESVIASYSRRGNDGGVDEVIVQRMVGRSLMSGVAFTHDLNTGAPYYVINYDDVSGLTNTVTAGEGEYSNRTIYIHRPASAALRSPRFRVLIEAIQELEQAIDSQFLDVEFAIGEDLTPYLLQVRLITTQPNWNRAVAKRINEALNGIQAFVRKRMQPANGVLGQTTVLGQMPDWNPAEMLGRAPRALALSLYQTLITDHAWRIARETMGYAVPTGQPLMVSLAGQPFVDTRMSFHSYLPAALDPAIGAKLVDAWVAQLRDHPELHDKIEFDVAITTYSFDLDDKIAAQTGEQLSAAEKDAFKSALRDMTRRLLADDADCGIVAALAKVERLAAKPITWGTSFRGHNLSTLYPMIDDCIHLGTVPFSILARHGFIARTLLLSLQRRGVLDAAAVGHLQAGIRTVASELVDDMRKLQLGELARTEFMARYGHLRPGTYDILSPRYDRIADLGRYAPPPRAVSPAPTFELAAEQRRAIDRLLAAEGFPELDADALLDYVRRATAGREYAKFVFTRSVSAMLELIAEFGQRHGLSRDELSHIEIRQLLDIATKSAEASVEDRLRRIAETEVDRHALSAAIRLPQVLFDEAGVRIVPFQVSHPNFITALKVTAPCLRLARKASPNGLGGHIILIENADPGFDWIFSQPIAGLITKYGGANSHMAIRCAEFGIPAAIGCGEQRFEALSSAQHIMLDCAAASIQILH